jgi:GDP-L-fucose synthase
VGFGSDVSIAELAQAVGMSVGFEGAIRYDASKPDGAPRKWMDSSCLNRLGWTARVDLEAGLAQAYIDFKSLHL